MKKFLKLGLSLILVVFAFSISAFAAPQNWEQIYPDEPNIYLDTNSVVKSPEGDMIAFVEKTDLSTPYYKNRAFELETIVYIPRTSQWRRHNHVYFDINHKMLEGHDYSLQTAPWAKVSPNDAVIKRVMEIANGDSVKIIGNQAPAPTTNNQPLSTVNNSNEISVFDGTIQQYYNSHFSDKGQFFIEHSKEFGVRKVILSNLTCDKVDGAGINLFAIESEFPAMRNFLMVELLKYDGEPPYFVVGSQTASAIDYDADRLKVPAYETESLLGLKGTVTISFDRATLTSTVTVDHILDDGNHEVLTKAFTHGPTMLCYSSNIEKTTMNGNIKVYKM